VPTLEQPENFKGAEEKQFGWHVVDIKHVLKHKMSISAANRC